MDNHDGPEFQYLDSNQIVEGMRFQTLDDAVAAIQRFAATNNFSVCKASAKRHDKMQTIMRQVVRCSRSGTYKPAARSADSANDRKKRIRRSKKTDCPFRINVRYRKRKSTRSSLRRPC